MAKNGFENFGQPRKLFFPSLSEKRMHNIEELTILYKRVSVSQLIVGSS